MSEEMRDALPGGRRVLIVDDDRDLCAMLGDALGAAGFEVAIAADGVAALAIVARRDPDVILLDLHMPNMGGEAFAARYRGLPGKEAALVLMSGAADLPGRALEMGARAYVRKPFELDHLLRLIDGCA